MNPGEIEEYLLDFQSRELPELVGRELQLSESKKPKSIIGPRRAGKTFFLFQKMKELLAKGVAKNQIVFLNFEDPRLIGVSFKEVFEIIKLQWRLFPESAGKELFVTPGVGAEMRLFLSEIEDLRMPGRYKRVLEYVCGKLSRSDVCLSSKETRRAKYFGRMLTFSLYGPHYGFPRRCPSLS